MNESRTKMISGKLHYEGVPGLFREQGGNLPILEWEHRNKPCKRGQQKNIVKSLWKTRERSQRKHFKGNTEAFPLREIER